MAKKNGFVVPLKNINYGTSGFGFVKEAEVSAVLEFFEHEDDWRARAMVIVSGRGVHSVNELARAFSLSRIFPERGQDVAMFKALVLNDLASAERIAAGVADAETLIHFERVGTGVRVTMSFGDDCAGFGELRHPELGAILL